MQSCEFRNIVLPETGELEVAGEPTAAANADLPALGAWQRQATQTGVPILQTVQPEELT